MRPSGRIWAAAWNAAQEAIQTERDGLAAARKKMEPEHEEITREITELEGKLETTISEKDALARSLDDERKSHEEAKERLTQLQVENARFEERVANTEKRANELNDQVKRLEKELARLAQEKTKPAAKKGS